MTQPGKDFWLPFHVKDFYADLIIHPHEIGGAWPLILCKLHATGGEASKPLSQWAKILNTSEEIALERLEYLKVELIADVTFDDATITVVSRRMSRDQKDRIDNRKRQADYRKRIKEQKSNANVTPIKKKRKEKKKKEDTYTVEEIETFKAVCDHFKKVTGKIYNPNTANTRKHIHARMQEGHTLEDFKKVIDNKAAQWLGDSKNDKFLRPSTLFIPSKFEGYLNEMPGEPDARAF